MSEECKYCGAKIHLQEFGDDNRWIAETPNILPVNNQVCPQHLNGNREHEPLILGSSD